MSPAGDPAGLITGRRGRRAAADAGAVGAAASRGSQTLGADGAVLVLRVPGLVHGNLLNVRSAMRSVDDHPATDVHPDVPLTVVEDQVARLERGQRDVRQRIPFFVGGPRDRDPGGGPRRLDESGAVEAVRTRPGAAVDVRAG